MRKLVDTRQKILDILKETNRSVSGQFIAKRLGISRTAVWKHISILQKDGYLIESRPNFGYKLKLIPDLLLPTEIKPFLQTNLSRICYYRSIDSTNNQAKAMIKKGVATPLLLIAERQSKGRGRQGRNWQSPRGGIWFSILLKPHLRLSNASRVSIAVAVAVCSVLRKKYNLPVEIKWPNDIFLNGRKVAGILIELEAELEQVNYLIIGVGINANFPSACLSKDLRLPTISFLDYLGKPVNRAMLTGTVVDEIIEKVDSVSSNNFNQTIRLWKQYSCTLGRKVEVRTETTTYFGLAKDIDSNGELILVLENGDSRTFQVGEVSLF
jgi:BirA family biotin operon repressor/biotin-[acetyl-CoA-carboxylase] ligase